MGSRERKRTARRKRKTRSAAHHTDSAAGELDLPAASSNGTEGERDLIARAESPSQRKDREAREALVPLREGERPTIVTVAAAISTALTALSLLGYALWDVLRPDEPRPEAIGVVAFVAMIGTMAYGLWRTRYWAVLGFQTVLVLVIVASALGLLASLSVLLAIGNLVLLGAAGTLFYFMIKAWARIQMPTRLPRE